MSYRITIKCFNKRRSYIKHKFDPRDYPEYEHTMTHQDESGIENYNKFATWEFRI